MRVQELALKFHHHVKEVLMEVVQEVWENEPELCRQYMGREEGELKVDPAVMPFMNIQARLNAFFVSDGRKRMKPNDLMDIDHAAFSLPYVDVFACDGPMAHAIQQPPHKLNKSYGVTVCGSLRELINFLKKL